MLEFLDMRIKSLKLQDHPVLGDLELDFTVGDRVADNIIIAGENGCGKTTLLKVISDFFEILGDPKSWSPTDRKGKFHDVLIGKSPIRLCSYNIEVELSDLWETPELVSLLESSQVGVSMDSNLSEAEQNRRMALESCSISIKDDRILFNEQDLSENEKDKHEINAQDTERMSILWNIKTLLIKSDFDIKTKAVENLSSSNKQSLYPNSSDAQAIKELFITLAVADGIKLMKSIKEETDKNITLETFHKKNEPTLNIFTEVFNRMDLDKDFKEIRQNYSSWDVVFTSKHLKDAEILLENLSSGEKQIIFKGVYFLREFAKHQDPNNKTNPTIACLIDEPEISMHPGWQKKILNFYKGLVSNADKKQTSQIFMATHSPFIIHEANLKTDKVIVLKKDDTGKIIVDKNPLFERCDGERFIEAAFNIDNFRKTNKPLVITEGKTDKKILETAWEKLYLNVEMPFEILDAGTHPNAKNRDGGAKELNEQLRYICNFPPHHKIIGMFDNDGAGNDQFNGLQTGNDGWKILTPKISNLEETLVYKKHPKNEVYAILLPIPSHREIYKKPNTQLSDYLCIEHYFNDSVLNTNSLQGPTQVTGTSIFQIGDEDKKCQSPQT